MLLRNKGREPTPEEMSRIQAFIRDHGPKVPGAYEGLTKTGRRFVKSLPRKGQYSPTMYQCHNWQYWPADVLHDVVHDSLRDAKVDRNRILPAHPSWIFDTGGINVVLAKAETMSWLKLMELINISDAELIKTIFIRAGKDGWGSPYFKKALRFLVTEDPQSGGHDGSACVRESSMPAEMKGQLHLFRGTPLVNGKPDLEQYMIAKGRLVVNDTLTCRNQITGELLPEGIDGQITVQNFKWRKPEVGEVIELGVHLVQNENGHDRDDGGYRLNLLAYIIGDFPESDRMSMNREFTRLVKRTATHIANPTKNLLKEMQAIASDLQEEGGLRSGQLARHALGLAAEQDLWELWGTIARKGRSVKVRHSAYPAVLFMTEVKLPDGTVIKIEPGCPLVSESMAKKVGKRKFTGARYPITTHQSYVQLCAAGMIPGFEGDVIVMHPNDAKHLQGDNDDHLLVMFKLVSNFVPGSEHPIIARPPEIGFGKMDRIDLYLRPARAQAAVGGVFNTYIRTVGVMKDLEYSEAELTAAIVEFGEALDICVQGIKKPYQLPDVEAFRTRLRELWDELAETDTPRYWSHIANVSTSKFKDVPGKSARKNRASVCESVSELWGVQYPDEIARREWLMLRKPCHADRELGKRFGIWGSKIDTIKDVKSWHLKLLEECAQILNVEVDGRSVTSFGTAMRILGRSPIDTVREKGSDILRAVDTYAWVAYYLGKKAKDSPALASMDGVLVLASQLIGLDPKGMGDTARRFGNRLRVKDPKPPQGPGSDGSPILPDTGE